MQGPKLQDSLGAHQYGCDPGGGWSVVISDFHRAWPFVDPPKNNTMSPHQVLPFPAVIALPKTHLLEGLGLISVALTRISCWSSAGVLSHYRGLSSLATSTPAPSALGWVCSGSSLSSKCPGALFGSF